MNNNLKFETAQRIYSCSYFSQFDITCKIFKMSRRFWSSYLGANTFTLLNFLSQRVWLLDELSYTSLEDFSHRDYPCLVLIRDLSNLISWTNRILSNLLCAGWLCSINTRLAFDSLSLTSVIFYHTHVLFQHKNGVRFESFQEDLAQQQSYCLPREAWFRWQYH